VFGDGGVGGPALIPNHTYTVRTRATDFGSFGVTFNDFQCVTASTCEGVTPFTVRPLLSNPPPLSPFEDHSGFVDEQVDNAACEAVWVPTVLPPWPNDQGFVPQGLAVSGGTALVSGYMFPGFRCRIVGVNLETGASTGTYDLPTYCRHAGGISIDGAGRIWISDTRQVGSDEIGKLILLRNPADLFSGDPRPIFSEIEIGLKGSFLVDSGANLWIGNYTKTGPGSIYKFPISSYLLPRVLARQPIELAASTGLRSVPRKTQGASFNGTALWASSSTSTWGELRAGASGVKAFGPGTEEILFSGGCLWAVFEAGSKRWPTKSFTVVARFDPGLITGTGPSASCARN
jgi:hypothetical protein